LMFPVGPNAGLKYSLECHSQSQPRGKFSDKWISLHENTLPELNIVLRYNRRRG
jgi:hypothetical protein